jgi:hypothetical protein
MVGEHDAATEDDAATDLEAVGGDEAPSGSGLLTLMAAGAIAAFALGWFAVALLVLRSSLVDAIGETAGGVLAVLVVVSVVGAVRRSGRR